MDIREAILSRMLTILDGTGGVRAYRNLAEIQESIRPCIVLIDGDEDAEQRDNNRGGRSPRRVTMLPEIYILLGSQSETVGSELNAIRAGIIHDLTHDSTLNDLTINSDGIAYEGAQSIIESGRRVEGAMVLRFAISYLLRPSELATSG